MDTAGADRSGLAHVSRAFEARAAIAASVVIVVIMGFEWIPWLAAGDFSSVGMDFVLYVDAATRWILSGEFYNTYQLAGPYQVVPGDILYPPPILILLVPFTVAPAALWWVIPVTVVAAVLLRHRPRPIAWAAIVLCVMVPSTTVKLVHGNPVMWITAALALGTIFSWPSVMVLLKPTLAPFAIVGIRHRSWWIGLGVAALVSLAFLPMWPDWVRAIQNAQDPAGILYSFNDLPFLAIPLVAWIGGIRWALREPGGAPEAPAS